ncbi:MAG: DUF1073 domain-containing protein, partial [Clostridia bacterium]|nr:DUF1073 domain-containing protein [Clostridia bacterium]
MEVSILLIPEDYLMGGWRGKGMFLFTAYDSSTAELLEYGKDNTSSALRAPSPQGEGFMGYQRVKIHHSRVLRFVGRELPYMETVAEDYWGASELEHIWDELQKRSATSANIAQLIFQANITTLKMGDLGEHLAYGSDNLQSKI